MQDSGNNNPGASTEHGQAMSTIGVIFGEIANNTGGGSLASLGTGTAAASGDAFEGLPVPQKNDWSIELAYLCVLVSAVYADGVAVEAELDYVRALVKRCSTMRGQTQSSLAQLNLHVMERMRTRHDYLAEACSALPRDMHLPLFAHCVDIVLADGDLADKERDFLDSLIQKMSISPEQARRVMEVIFEKNRY